VIENLLAVAPEHAAASFYRTSTGVEIDLVLELGGNHGIWTVEIKRGSAPRLDKGNRQAIKDIQPAKSFVVYPGEERFPMEQGVEAIGLIEMMGELKALA